MKKIFVLAIALLTITLTSCKKETLQTYLVETQEKKNFTTFDFSTSILPISLVEASIEDKNALASVRKVNIAFLQKKKATETELNAEKTKLQAILKNTDYKVLMKFNDKKSKATIYYTGKTDAIDELIVFGFSEEVGVGVARLLGDNMNPASILKMLKKADVSKKDDDFKKLKEIFKEQNKSE